MTVSSVLHDLRSTAYLMESKVNGLLKVLGVLLIIAGIVGGISVDIIYFFVGGIMQVVEGATADPVSAHDIGWGLAKALLFTGVGVFVAIFLMVAPGIALVTTESVRRR